MQLNISHPSHFHIPPKTPNSDQICFSYYLFFWYINRFVNNKFIVFVFFSLLPIIFLIRSKPEYTSYTTYFPAICGSDSSTTVIQQQQQHNNSGQLNQGCKSANNQTRRHTIISTTLTNYNHQMSSQASALNSTPSRRASISWENQTAYKPVKITLIGDPLKQWSSSGCVNKTLHINEEELKKNFINCSIQQEQNQNGNNNNNNNNLILNGSSNSKTHQHLQEIMKANDLLAQTTQTHTAPTHHQTHQPQYQQQHYHQTHAHPHPHHHHQHHRHHQHNNLKPTVTIV